MILIYLKFLEYLKFQIQIIFLFLLL